MVRVKKVAEQVRKAFEEVSRNEQPSKKDHDLCGYCCRASVHLFLAAKRHGIDGVKLVLGNGHVFNMFNDHIVDVTCTQFGIGNSVHIIPYSEQKKNFWDKMKGPFDKLEDFMNTAWKTDVDTDLSTVMKYDQPDPFEEYPYV